MRPAVAPTVSAILVLCLCNGLSSGGTSKTGMARNALGEQLPQRAASCPDQIPSALVAQMRDPEVRDAAARLPRMTSDYIAANGGAAVMIAKLEQQLVEDDRWIREETVNQQQLQGDDKLISFAERQKALRMMQDNRRINAALLDLLRCHAQNAPSVSGASAGGSLGAQIALQTGNCGDQPWAGENSKRMMKNSKGLNAYDYMECDLCLRGYNCDRSNRNGRTSQPAGGSFFTGAADIANQLEALRPPPTSNQASLTPENATNAFTGTPNGAPPERLQTGGSPGQRLASDIDDLLNPDRGTSTNDCEASVQARDIALDTDGRSVQFTLVATHAKPQACMVTFGAEVRAGPSLLSTLAARTVTVPPGGMRLSETASLAVPVQRSSEACAQREPVRQTLLNKRQELHVNVERIRAFESDSRASVNTLQRSIGQRDIAQALVAMDALIDVAKDLLPPALGASLGAGECVAGELVSFAAKSTAACTNPDNVQGCVQSVLEDGTLWAMKTTACAAGETMQSLNKLGKMANVAGLANAGRTLSELQSDKENAVEVLNLTANNLDGFVRRLDRLRAQTAIVNELLDPLNQLCRTPQINVAPTGVQSMLQR